jgi:D-alanyl-D-alanine carboxypeptidase
MLELLLFIEFLKNTFNYNYHQLNLANPQSILNYQEFKTENIEKINLNLDSSQLLARNVLVKEIGGRTLFEKNSYEKKPIASLTKLLTAIAASNFYQTNTIFTIKEEIINNPDAEKSSNLKPLEKYNLDELLHMLLISSSNIAAWTLADKIGQENFVKQMNYLSQIYGLKDSYFEEPSGVSEKNISTLQDLYLLIQEILKNYPNLLEISRKTEYVIKLNNGHQKYFFNTNYLLNKYRSIIIGSKTGYTSQAGECLILIVKLPQSPLIFIGLLDSKNRLSDAEYIIKKLKEIYQN